VCNVGRYVISARAALHSAATSTASSSVPLRNNDTCSIIPFLCSRISFGFTPSVIPAPRSSTPPTSPGEAQWQLWAQVLATTNALAIETKFEQQLFPVTD
jgi:hypothetical protein